METKTIIAAIRELIRIGRLQVRNDEIFIDDESVTEQAEQDDGYLDSGWSEETSHGCRRHIAIDQFLEELSAGDEHQQAVAESADVWFCFSPEHNPELEAEDEEERNQARRARFNSRILARWLTSGVNRDVIFDFRISAERWGIDSDNYWVMPDKHAVVYATSPVEEAPDRWPEQYINQLKSEVEERRSGRHAQAEAWLNA